METDSTHIISCRGIKWAYQRNHNEGWGRDSGTHVGPHPAAVQDAHPPGQLALEQGAHLGVEHDLEVTLHDKRTALCCKCYESHVTMPPSVGDVEHSADSCCCLADLHALLVGAQFVTWEVQ